MDNQASNDDLSVIPESEGLRELDPQLASMLERAMQLLPSGPVSASGVKGVLSLLDQNLQAEKDALRKQHLLNLLNSFRTYFKTPSLEEPEWNDGQVLAHIASDLFSAALSIIPPRGNGRMPTENRIRFVLEKAGVKHGLDMNTVNAALEAVRKNQEVIWHAIVARGEPPIPGRPDEIQFNVPIIDKGTLRSDPNALQATFESLDNPVQEGTVIGRLRPAQAGVPGMDVRGAHLPPPSAPRRAYELTDDLQLSNNTLITQSAGYVVLDDYRITVLPIYAIDHPAHKSMEDISFSGGVLVRGVLQGPGNVQCEDLFVLGNCEQINVVAQGDIFIAGGLIGHRQSSIEADGGIYTAFVSEANISALGEIVVSNAIINSRVISNDSVRVTSPKGILTGGTVQALKDIVVQTIGSEFGMLTETVAGKDFLTTQRLEDISRKIRLHEDNLRRIQELKTELTRARVRIEQLPPDKQEIYIGVLRKEAASQAELKSLSRRKLRLSQGLKEFITASIQVLSGLYPPVRIQVVNGIMDITKRLNAVTLQYDKNSGIVSNFPTPDTEGTS